MYKYVDFPIRNKAAYELAEWMDEIKYTQRTKASKLYKLVRKYEIINEPYQWIIHPEGYRVQKYILN